MSFQINSAFTLFFSFARSVDQVSIFERHFNWGLFDRIRVWSDVYLNVQQIDSIQLKQQNKIFGNNSETDITHTVYTLRMRCGGKCLLFWSFRLIYQTGDCNVSTLVHYSGFNAL